MSGSLWYRLGCCVTGHDYSVRSDRERIYLRCDACGHTSDGWSLSNDPHLTRSIATRLAAHDRPQPPDRRRLAAR
jgi:hypothetical protein